MVRTTRFQFDGDLPDDFDRLGRLDDVVPTDVPDVDEADPGEAVDSGSDVVDEPRRHLADADWTKPRRSRRPAS